MQDTVGRYGSLYFTTAAFVYCEGRVPNRDERVALSDDDARALRRFQRLLVMLVLLLLVTHGHALAWPFVIWPIVCPGLSVADPPVLGDRAAPREARW